MNENIHLLLTFIFELFLTLFLYLLVPVLVRIFYKKALTKKRCFLIAIVNGFCVSFLFFYLRFLISGSLVAYTAQGFIWTTVSCFLLKKAGTPFTISNIFGSMYHSSISPKTISEPHTNYITEPVLDDAPQEPLKNQFEDEEDEEETPAQKQRNHKKNNHRSFAHHCFAFRA